MNTAEVWYYWLVCHQSLACTVKAEKMMGIVFVELDKMLI